MLIAIVVFLIMLLVIILAHELGHFITAKASGVKVEEFGIGFPPRIIGVKRGETVYSLNVIPLGGFTKMAGEEDPSVARSLASKSKRVRIVVLSAGSIMNLLLPLVFFSVAFMVPHGNIMEPVKVKAVAEGSPAARAGVLPGDTIIGIDGHSIESSSDLHRYIQLDLGNEVTLVVRRNSTTREIRVVPRWQPPPGQGATGVEIDIEAALAHPAQ